MFISNWYKINYCNFFNMGLIIIRIVTFFKIRVNGGYLIIISHRLRSSGLSFSVNVIYSQTNRRLIFINKGIINFTPSMSLLWFILCLSNIGSPVSLNLIREVILLIFVYQKITLIN